MNKLKWYDDWESGWKDDKGKRVFYFKLPNSNGDFKCIKFREGQHNWKIMEALHSVADSALTELGNIK